MTTGPMAKTSGHKSTLEGLMGIKDQVEPRVLQLAVTRQIARTEEYNTSNRAVLEAGVHSQTPEPPVGQVRR